MNEISTVMAGICALGLLVLFVIILVILPFEDDNRGDV